MNPGKVLIFTFLLNAQILSHSILTTDLEPPCDRGMGRKQKNLNQMRLDQINNPEV